MEPLDLNLLRVFDVVYRTRNVSRAAELLGMSQPSTSQALTRLRLSLGDPLFMRTHGGVRPTPRAEDLARSVQSGLAHIEAGLAAGGTFDAARTCADLRIHLTDIGEARFLPPLMKEIRQTAPGIQLHARAWAQEDIGPALDSGDLHLAIGFLPELATSAHAKLITDRYVVMLRAGHPIASKGISGALTLRKMQSLDWIAVRSHAQTLQMLQATSLDNKVMLTTSTFLALPDIVKNTDLAVLMPRAIALKFTPNKHLLLLDTELSSNDFTVSVHWSRRHAHLPLVRWARELLLRLFEFKDNGDDEPVAKASRT